MATNTASTSTSRLCAVWGVSSTSSSLGKGLGGEGVEGGESVEGRNVVGTILGRGDDLVPDAKLLDHVWHDCPVVCASACPEK